MKDPQMASIIETTGGRLRGITYGLAEAFLGIPYAMPPIPPRRFMDPRPAAPWTGVREADTFAPQAHQLPFPFLDPALAEDSAYDATREFHRGVVIGSILDGEDCLALNVWTPSTAGKRPVMVWLHGGGFAAGSGGWGWWTGEDLAANQDVVVVTLNHRLNIFGFLCLAEHGGPAHSIATNVGMRDIVTALEWVRDNIVAFGGDPGNVTIFGQSGGGMKVTTLMAMPAAKGLFHKAIVQSGPFVRAVPMTRASDLAAGMLDRLGIGSRQLDALQRVSPPALLDAFASAHEGAPGVPRQFAPVVDGDSLSRDPFEPGAPPTASGVPLMIGATGEEITSLQGFADPSIFEIGEARLAGRVATVCDIGPAAAEALISAYRVGRPRATAAQLYAAIVSDRRFGFGSIQQAERQAAQSPVFAYRLLWQSPVRGGRMGAPHNLDLPMIFGRDRAPGVTGDGTAHHALAAAMQTAWANFARSGNPSHAGLPDWPHYDAQTRRTMIFDTDCRVASDPAGAERRAQAALPPRVQ
jgi:para-nitrobenzyl esterase